MTYLQLTDAIRKTCVECLVKGWDIRAAKHLLKLQGVIAPLGHIDLQFNQIIELDTK